MKPETNYRAVGIAFMVLGAGLTASMGASLGVAFAGTGIPFLVIGAVYFAKSSAPAESEDAE